MQKLSNKQKPQLIMLIVLSVIVFGYFSFRMITPTPAAAHGTVASATPTPVKTVSAAVDAASAANPTADTTDTSLVAAIAPPPSSSMRDPFIPGILDPGTIAAYNNSRKTAAEAGKPQVAASQTTTHTSSAPSLPGMGANVPSVPSLPSPGSQSASAVPSGSTSGPSVLPVPAPAPAWSVTGVLHSGSDEVAILRNGATRRIVKAGDQVDSQYRIVSVTRQSVVLRHGQQTVTLPLGGAPAQTGSKGSPPGIASPEAASVQGLTPLPGLPQVQGPVH